LAGPALQAILLSWVCRAKKVKEVMESEPAGELEANPTGARSDLYLFLLIPTCTLALVLLLIRQNDRLALPGGTAQWCVRSSIPTQEQ
jgi:hypothetical protein